MTYEGPGALHWVAPKTDRRGPSYVPAALAGCCLGAVVFGAYWLFQPAPASERLEPVSAVIEEPVVVPRMGPPRPPDTWKAPYSHSAAMGTVTLSPKLGAPYVGVLVLPFAGSGRPEEDPEADGGR
ncbi:MAG: hypothetical protein HYY16_07555 [Planctomycetes bacterium]|nr:hypothetical protein [Planctomycetota bacterium]